MAEKSLLLLSATVFLVWGVLSNCLRQAKPVFQCHLPIKFLQPVLEDFCSHPGMWYILIIISYGILSCRGSCVMIIPLDTLITTPSEGRCDLYYYLT